MARHRFHLMFRVGASRVYELLAPEDDIGPWPSRRLRLACALISDGAWTHVLRRSRRSLLWPRALTDAADVVAWSVPAVKLDHTMATTVPLTIDAVTDLGPVGFAVPLCNWLLVAAARRRRGLSTSVAALIWPLTAGAIALSLRTYARQQDEAQRQRHEAELRAHAGSAFMDGQNAVAARADNIVDLLARTEPLVAAVERPDQVPRSGTARALHTWKAQLADATRQGGSYLGALFVHVAQRRQTSDLGADVVYELSEDDRVLVLSAAQAAWLTAALLVDPQTGVVSVDVMGGGDHRAGMGLELAVGGRSILVPADPDLDVPVVDVAPVVVLAGALWCALSALPLREDVAWWAVAPAVTVGVAAAVAVDRGRRAGCPWPVDRVVLAMLVGQALYSPLAAATMRRRVDDAGFQQFPQLGGYLFAAPALLGLDDPALSDRARVALGLGAVAAAAPGFVTDRQRIDLRHLAASSVLPLAGWVSARGVARGLHEHRRFLQAKLRSESDLAREQAYAAGRRNVIDLVHEAAEELEARLAALPADGPDDAELVREARRRVDWALSDLATLGARSRSAVRAIDGTTIASKEALDA